MLTDMTSNQVPTKKVLIPRNPKQFSISSSVNNAVIKNLVNTSQLVNNSNQKLFLLKVTDSKKQPHYIRLPSVNAIKLVNNQSNFDVKLEQVKAPTHVLDHSYAANENSKTNSSNTEVLTKPNESSVNLKQNIQPSYNFSIRQVQQSTQQKSSQVVKKICTEIKPKPIFIKPVNSEIVNKQVQQSLNSDKVAIAELKKQLNAKKAENQVLQKNLKRLQRESKSLIRKRLQDILKNVFSPTQIDKLLNPHKAKVKWTVEDIISALTLQNISLKAYTYLRDNNYPLPGLSTIRKWTAQINLTEGLLKDVLVIMKFRTKSLSIFQKIVILHFDELCISNESYLICIATGLFYKWMQPIYFSHKKSLSFGIIAEIVSQLFNAGFIVVALTCNLESKYIWRQLNIGIHSGEKCYILHPSKMNYKIYIFPSEYHLLTLIREQFLKHGFIVNGKRVNKQCIEELSTVCKKLEAAKFCKLTEGVLDDSKSDDSKVTIAKQLFSKEIADKIYRYGKEGYIPYNDWEKAAYFFDLMSQWIKLFNIKSSENYYNADEEPYGLNLENQNHSLDKIKKLMMLSKVESLETITISFQDQIILWINSLQELLTFLQKSFSVEEFPIKYVSTNKLSSDCLKNVIGYLTSSDGANSKPQDLSEVTLGKFQTKLRKCILGKYLSDTISGQIWKILDPCLIDFNEKSDTTISLNSLNLKEVDTNITKDEQL